MNEKLKVVLYTFLITLLCVVGSRMALSDDFSIRGGGAIVDGSLSGGSKIFGLRLETPLISGIEMAGEVGGYVDNLGNGRKGAALGKLQLGIKPGPKVGTYGSAFIGPCAISATDVLLGSPYQFCSDFGIGVRDVETFLSVTYSHISNAGLKAPNKGRDFVVMGMGFTFN